MQSKLNTSERQRQADVLENFPKPIDKKREAARELMLSVNFRWKPDARQIDLILKFLGIHASSTNRQP